METKIVRIITVSFMLTALLVALPLSGLGGRTPKAEAATLSGNWASLGFGFNNVVYAVAVSGTNVYVGGAFTQICGNATFNSGNITATHIAMWNGSSWSPVGNGVGGHFDSAVHALAMNGNTLYVGGTFRAICGNPTCDSGNTTTTNIAMWNGSNWSALGNGLGEEGVFGQDANGSVDALAVSGSDLYAGGGFYNICGDATCAGGNTNANHIAKWNGNSWSPLSLGLNNAVFTLVVSGTKLYAGGRFRFLCADAGCNSNGTQVNRVAMWNGAGWSSVGNG